jgi:hypothetical protein
MIERKILASRGEWLKHRSRIGGSDAAAIVGLNPYKTNTDLYLEKTGQKRAWVRFEAYLTSTEARALGAWFKLKNIKIRRI